MEIIYKNLQENEISRELFRHFVRHQTVVKCRRKENGKWIIKDDRIKNFFTDNYDHPIFECGVQLIDMVYLEKNLLWESNTIHRKK